MTVYFIGAGPGAPDLLTVRAQRLVRQCGTCLYAGSIVPPEVLALCPPISRIINTARMPLDEIVTELRDAHERGDDVARLHSGDPSLYSAISEQFAALDAAGIPWEIVPGVPAYTAAAAALRTELTIPNVAQTVILTRVDGRSTPMPEGEDLATACASGGTAVIHLAAHQAERVRDELEPIYGVDAPVAVAAYVSRPEEVLLRTTLGRLPEELAAAGVTRTAVIMIGAVFAETSPLADNPLRADDAVGAGSSAVAAPRSFLYSDDRPRDAKGRTLCDAPSGSENELGKQTLRPVPDPYKALDAADAVGPKSDQIITHVEGSGAEPVADDAGPVAESNTSYTSDVSDAIGDGAFADDSEADDLEPAQLRATPIERPKRELEESELAVPDPVLSADRATEMANSTQHHGAPPNKILILGGTSEGRELAGLISAAGLDVVTSLAGRVKRPRLPEGEVRIGGFGGPQGLGRYLLDHAVDLVIDATHPFAERISASAVEATASTGVPMLRLNRPQWTPGPGDEWISVPTAAEAARVVQERFKRPLLTIGRQNLAAFAGDARSSYLIRCVEPPEGKLPRRYLLMFDRGPFDFDSEHSLLRRHRIDVVVTKNSGGDSTSAKLEAARSLHIPVIMIERANTPPVRTVSTVREAAEWIVEVFGAARA